jgi:hypothetical protein
MGCWETFKIQTLTMRVYNYLQIDSTVKIECKLLTEVEESRGFLEVS